MRQIVLDTETTGLSPTSGDRIIEIGAIEIVGRKVTQNIYHQYINPERLVPPEAEQIHGISNDFLQDKPIFVELVDEFMQFISGAELIIHNAPFDISFINNELSLLDYNKWGELNKHCSITDSLNMAQKLYPAQRNSLDALCKRLGVDNSDREFHGALKDCKILANVYLTMSGGQKALFSKNIADSTIKERIYKHQTNNHIIPVIQPSNSELMTHANYINKLSKITGKDIQW